MYDSSTFENKIGEGSIFENKIEKTVYKIIPLTFFINVVLYSKILGHSKTTLVNIYSTLALIILIFV